MLQASCTALGDGLRSSNATSTVSLAAFRNKKVRTILPSSIRGLWKADLFVGYEDTDKWIGTTVKVNRSQLQAARGLRVGIVPTRQGRSDAIYRDEQKNLVVCPIPHDGAFMEIFYQGWGIIQQVLAADATLPREVNLPRPPERQVAKYLADRREFTVIEILSALAPLSQPQLLRTEPIDAEIFQRRNFEAETGAVVAPMSSST